MAAFPARVYIPPMKIPTLSIASLVVCFTFACGGSDPSYTPNPTPTPTGDGGQKPPPKWNAAVGAAGTFLQSLDGAAWSTRTLAQEDLLAVHCVSSSLGWAAGAGGLLLRTGDAGQTFTRLNTGTKATLRAVHFAADPAALGLVAGDGGTLLISRDGGDHWTRAAATTFATLHGVAIADAGRLLMAVGDGGVLILSGDGGASWTVRALSGLGDLRGVAASADGGLLLFADSRGGVWESRDRGVSLKKTATATAPLKALSLAEDGVHALAAGSAGAALSRDAAGWRALSTGTQVDLHAALWNRDGRQFLAGDRGTLLGSADSGATWQQAALVTDAAIYGMEDF